MSGTGIVDCLEIIDEFDVECNLKQFDGLTQSTLPPYFATEYATGGCSVDVIA